MKDHVTNIRTRNVTIRGASHKADRVIGKIASNTPTGLVTPKPFIKWVGGKRQLLPELLARLPLEYNRYFEPFIGGGALFFAHRPKKAFISDINEELVNAYRVLEDDVESLIAELFKHSHKHSQGDDNFSESYFYKLRNADRLDSYRSWSDVSRAGRFIYLNKTCYNGLYRVNSQGQFNAPFGDYKRPKICDVANLRACSFALKKARVHCMSFITAAQRAKTGDFVYFDPPYAPLNATSNFTGYAKSGFGVEDQQQLKKLCDALEAKGVKWMLSNSTAPLILDLYRDYRIEKVYASRAINSKAEKRGKIQELIIRNYE